MYSEKVLRWKEGRQNADVEEREGIRDEVACEQRDVGIQRADALFEPAPPLSISCRCFHEINELQLLNKKRQHPAELELVFAGK